MAQPCLLIGMPGSAFWGFNNISIYSSSKPPKKTFWVYIKRSHTVALWRLKAIPQIHGRRQIPPSSNSHPFTVSHQILHTWLRRPYQSVHTPNLVQMAQGVTSPHIAKVPPIFSVGLFSCTQNSIYAVESILTCDISYATVGSIWYFTCSIILKTPKTQF